MKNKKMLLNLLGVSKTDLLVYFLGLPWFALMLAILLWAVPSASLIKTALANPNELWSFAACFIIYPILGIWALLFLQGFERIQRTEGWKETNKLMYGYKIIAPYIASYDNDGAGEWKLSIHLNGMLHGLAAASRECAQDAPEIMSEFSGKFHSLYFALNKCAKIANPERNSYRCA